MTTETTRQAIGNNGVTIARFTRNIHIRPLHRKVQTFDMTSKNRPSLSKGSTHSPRAREYIIVNYEKPEYREIGDISQVRPVWNGTEYKIHIFHEMEVLEELPDYEVAGVDSGFVP